MKGVIIAGGTGSRLYPLTKIINKNVLAVYDKPLIYYPILTLRDAGINEILIISGRGHAGQYLDLLGAGSQFGVRLSYEIQEYPGGIAQAIGLAERFADGDQIIVILGDNIYQDRFRESVQKFLKQEKGAMVFLKEVENPRRFGVPVFDDGKIVEIIEKPKEPPSQYAVTGLYMYDNRAFEVIRTLKPSARGEIEVTDLNNFYAREGTLDYEVLKGVWIDAGTFDSLLHANLFVAYNKEHLPQFNFKEEYPGENKNV
ncbi:MAG: spore coat protein [Calditrichaeota bacterium]|nr:MAG: spore coat protein [Calditrichota bacterium]